MLLGIDASRANQAEKTGVGSYAFFVIEELKKIIPENINVVLYTDKPLTGALGVLPKNWQEKILSWPPRYLWTQARLSWEMLFHAPDVLFVPAHVPPLFHPKKTIMTVHDVAAVHFPESYSCFEKWYSVASAKYAVKKLVAVIVPSQAVKGDLLALVCHKDRKNIFVVPHGYNPIFNRQVGTEEQRTIKAKYNLPEKYILSVGRLEEKKNTARLILAFEKAVQQGFDLNLVLVGKSGFGYEKVEKVLQVSPVREKIQVIPWVAENDLPGIFQQAQIFMFPSLAEGFGLPILEAFASRTPVIASTAGSLPEVAGDAALFVDPFSVEDISLALLALARDQEKRFIFKQRGLARLTQFSWVKSAHEIFRITCTCET